MDLDKIDLNAPFTDDENTVAETATAEDSQPKVEDKEPVTPALDADDTETKVPYSRFSTALSRAKEAERAVEEAEERAREAEERYERVQRERPVTTQEGELPPYWVKLYGDSDNSKEAFKYELQRQAQVKEEAVREAREAVREERTTEARVVRENVGEIDERLEDLSVTLGRDITEDEEEAILDIVDDYTPKDEDGNYEGALLPFDKAYEIYELRQAKSASGQKASRSKATALTGTQTQGDTSTREEEDKNWDPRNPWGWMRNIK